LVLLLWCLHPAASSPGRETSSHYPQMPCEPGHCPQGPASSLREGQHSALAHNEYYLWNHKMKRCDMQRPFFEGPHGAPWYTEGRWVPSYEERRSVLEYMPMDCVESTAACPSGGCCPSEYGCTPGATSSPLEVCQSYHAPCFESRSGNTFSQNLRNFAFVWQPSDSCYFSSLTVTPPAMWHQYAASIEEAAGPIFFVGDTPLSELFIAFQHHTNGAVHSDFQYTNTLVNSYTLRPMTPKQVEKCATPDSGGTLPTHADAITPCPPSGRSGLPYEVNTHHRLHNMYWTIPFMHHAQDPIRPLKTLVLGTGSHLWKQHVYPAAIQGCATPNGDADAFKPYKSLDLGTDYGCDFYSERYPILVQSVARFIGNSPFTGHVIFVTTPHGARDCQQVASPMAPRPLSAFSASPDRYLGYAHPADYYYNQSKRAELVWQSAFQKWAPRVKLSVLNITHLSEMRADALIPTEAGGQFPLAACEAFCLPGMPHVWSEMLIRLIEQYHFHN